VPSHIAAINNLRSAFATGVNNEHAPSDIKTWDIKP